MSEGVDISETRHGQILAELAGLGLTLARDLHERALAAETAEQAAKLATAFHRISRGVRQSLALEARLGREQEAQAIQLAPLRERARLERVSRRQAQVFAAVEPLIWNETEDAETAGHLVEDLRERLDAEALDDAFLAEPLDRQLDRIRALFDLAAPDPVPDAEAGSQTDAEAAAGARPPPAAAASRAPGAARAAGRRSSA